MFSIVEAALVAFFITVICSKFMLPILIKMKFGQYVRDCGPQSHLKKSGTPTMGGLMIITGFALSSLIFIKDAGVEVPIILFSTAFGLTGFLDDYLKLKKKKSEGLKSYQKFAIQFVITLIFAFYVRRYFDNNIFFNDKDILIPFTGGYEKGVFISLKFLFVPFILFTVLGTDNGVNFTDGLDGLCTSVSLAVFAFFAAVSLKYDLVYTNLIGAIIGALLGFLIFNMHPAKVFMGDTGSLFIGALVSSVAVMMKLPLFIIIVGFIYLIEVLSVIIQVSYFKITHGKRIFKMSPIHHHFELSGYSETEIVGKFTVVTLILSMVAFLIFK